MRASCHAHLDNKNHYDKPATQVTTLRSAKQQRRKRDADLLAKRFTARMASTYRGATSCRVNRFSVGLAGSKDASNAISRPLTTRPDQRIRESAAASFACELMPASCCSGWR